MPGKPRLATVRVVNHLGFGEVAARIAARRVFRALLPEGITPVVDYQRGHNSKRFGKPRATSTWPWELVSNGR